MKIKIEISNAIIDHLKLKGYSDKLVKRILHFWIEQTITKSGWNKSGIENFSSWFEENDMEKIIRESPKE